LPECFIDDIATAVGFRTGPDRKVVSQFFLIVEGTNMPTMRHCGETLNEMAGRARCVGSVSEVF
jgi:hypothetical protein